MSNTGRERRKTAASSAEGSEPEAGTAETSDPAPPRSVDPGRDLVRASGCVVYRWLPPESQDQDEAHELQVLVAHRPRYDDWDFPKGKLEEGETELECALRETEEETGFTGEVGVELPSDHYQVRGRDKRVRWWLLQQTGGRFVVNDEVDQVRWLVPSEAAQVLSYEHAVRLLDHLPDRI